MNQLSDGFRASPYCHEIESVSLRSIGLKRVCVSTFSTKFEQQFLISPRKRDGFMNWNQLSNRFTLVELVSRADQQSNFVIKATKLRHMCLPTFQLTLRRSMTFAVELVPVFL